MALYDTIKQMVDTGRLTPDYLDLLSRHGKAPKSEDVPAFTPQEVDTRKIAYNDPNAETMRRQVGSSPIGIVLPNNDYRKDAEQRVSQNVMNALTGGESMVPIAGTVLKGYSSPILVNPTKAELKGFLSRTRYNEVRGVKDPATGDQYFGDANLFDHKGMAEELGLSWDKILDADASHRVKGGDWLVDKIKSNNPLEGVSMYHGTDVPFDTFHADKPLYFTPRDDYSYIKNSPRVIEANLDIKNPYRPTNKSEIEQVRSNPEFMQELINKGYDGMVWSKPDDLMRGASGWGDDLPQVVAFRPEQVKTLKDTWRK